MYEWPYAPSYDDLNKDCAGMDIATGLLQPEILKELLAGCEQELSMRSLFRTSEIVEAVAKIDAACQPTRTRRVFNSLLACLKNESTDDEGMKCDFKVRGKIATGLL